ncbi:MAG: hypothetical protein ABI114_06855 [Rhodanobacter sp.]
MLLNPARLFLVASAGLLLASCAHQQTMVRPVQPTSAPAITGIAECDSYLASYVACHRAGAIFPASQVPAHYQAMRESLLRQSQVPTIRPELAQRCAALTTQLQQALHGKSCSAATAIQTPR